MKDLAPTLTGILILIFAVLPGVPGDRMYRVFVGYDWREDQWQRILRLITFSLFGLALYTSVAPFISAPFPAYLSPALLEKAVANETSFGQVMVSLLGHFAGASFAGAASGLALRLIARFRASSAYYSAWDHFVRNCAKSHWVLIGLQNGESYSGFIETADVSVAASDRDIILREPALYDAEQNEFVALGYQSLFIPGSLVSSLSTVFDSTRDKRIIPVGESVFTKENRDVDEIRASSEAKFRPEIGQNSSESGSPYIQATGVHAEASSNTETQVT